MVITCPSCKRRFNLPVDKVRQRQAKLKCSRCKSMFAQDLAELVGVASAKLTEAEERAIAALPLHAPPPARPPAAPPRAPGTKPMAAVAARAPAAPGASGTKPMPVVAPRPPTPAARPAPAAPPAPPAPPKPPPRPPAPRPAPKPVEPVMQGYESYAEPPPVGEEHQEALERAAEAEAAQASLQAQQEAEAQAAVEAAASQAAVDAALEQATAEAVAQGGVPVEGASGYEEPFAPPVTDELPAELAAGLEAIAEGRTPEEAIAARAAAQQALRGSDSHTQAALDMFQGAQTPSGRFALPAGGEFDDVVLLSDEEAPSPLRWVGLGVGVLLALLAGTTLFVLARNDWKIDFGRLWDQVKHAFGAGAAVTDQRACLAASVRIPSLVRASDGAVVIVRGTINNFCSYSVSRASIRCTLEGRGGSWTDTARPFRDSGASDLSEADLDGKSTLGVARAIEDEENPSGVVLPGVTHEFWCAFPGAADAKSKASQFTPSFEVVVP